jgi:hypothetical protein
MGAVSSNLQNSGASWVSIGSFPPGSTHAAISALLIIPSLNTIFVGTEAVSGSRSDAIFQENSSANDGLWLSTDAGQHWSQYPTSNFGGCMSPFGGPCAAESLAVDPTNPNQVYVGIRSGNVYRITHSAAGWSQPVAMALPGNPAQDRQTVAVGPPSAGAPASCTNNGVAQTCGTVYAMVGSIDMNHYQGFYQSIDGGNNWTSRTVPFATLSNGSTIDGTAGANFSQSFYDQTLVVLPSDPMTVFFGGIGLYESSDGGTTWTSLTANANGGTHSDQHAMAFDPSNSSTLWIGDDGGVYSLSGLKIGGTQIFSAQNAFGPFVGQIQGLDQNETPDSNVLAGLQDNGTLFSGISTDTGDGGFTLYDKVNPSVAYHTFASPSGNAVRVGTSPNQGSSAWTDSTFTLTAPGDSGMSVYPPIAVDPNVANRIFIGGHFVYVSANGSQTWRQQSSSDITGGCTGRGCALDDLEFVPPNSSSVPHGAWAVSQLGGGVGFRVSNTTNADCPDQPTCTTGLTAAWSALTVSGVANNATQATGIAVDPTDTTGQTAYLSLSGFSAKTTVGHIYKTTDFGATWCEADGNNWTGNRCTGTGQRSSSRYSRVKGVGRQERPDTQQPSRRDRRWPISDNGRWQHLGASNSNTHRTRV